MTERFLLGCFAGERFANSVHFSLTLLIFRVNFDEEIRHFIERPDEDFLKAYSEKLGALVLYTLINDIRMGGGWVNVPIPVVKDRLWVEHHILAKAKVGSYGSRPNDLKEISSVQAAIKENPEKFKTQTDSLKASLKRVFPDEVKHLEKLWQIQ